MGGHAPPWERYATDAAESIQALPDREEAEPSRPLGRALDLGCGRGTYASELAGRGWDVVGIDNVPRAIEAANRRGVPGATFVVGGVTSGEVEAAFPGWEMVSVEPADTSGLGWPQNKTSPQWYRLAPTDLVLPSPHG